MVPVVAIASGEPKNTDGITTASLFTFRVRSASENVGFLLTSGGFYEFFTRALITAQMYLGQMPGHDRCSEPSKKVVKKF